MAKSMKKLLLAYILAVALVHFASFVTYCEEPAKLRVHFRDVHGGKLPKEAVQRLHCRDLSDEPCPARIYVHEGYATVVLPNKPVQICALIKIPDFGEVTIYADGRGKGYSRPGDIDFIEEAAATRLIRVESAAKEVEREGLV